MAHPETRQDRKARFANLFVVVALVAMLIGAVLIIQAREVHVVDLEPGESATLFDFATPSWDPLGHTLRIVLHGPANMTLFVNTEGTAEPGRVTIDVRETSGAEGMPETEEVADLSTLERATWSHSVQPGERWSAMVENDWEDDLRVTATVSSNLSYAVGGALVVVGILGFVSYRIGIRRD